jgi:hypothetical protein
LFWRLGLTFLVLVLAILAGAYWSISVSVTPNAAAVVRHALWLAALGVLIVSLLLSCI